MTVEWKWWLTVSAIWFAIYGYLEFHGFTAVRPVGPFEYVCRPAPCHREIIDESDCIRYSRRDTQHSCIFRERPVVPNWKRRSEAAAGLVAPPIVLLIWIFMPSWARSLFSIMFKKELSVSAAAKVAISHAMRVPGVVDDQLAPFGLGKSESYGVEIFALVHAMTVVSLKESAFSADGKRQVVARITPLLTDFLARKMTGKPAAGEEAAGLVRLFERRCAEYCKDSSEKPMAAIFLRHVGRVSPDEVLLKTTAATIGAIRDVLSAEMRKLSRHYKLVLEHSSASSCDAPATLATTLTPSLGRPFRKSNGPEAIRGAYQRTVEEVYAGLTHALHPRVVPQGMPKTDELYRKMDAEVTSGGRVVAALYAYMTVRLALLRNDRRSSWAEIAPDLAQLKEMAIKEFEEVVVRQDMGAGATVEAARANAARLAARDFSSCDGRVQASLLRFSESVAFPLDPILQLIDEHFPLALGTDASSRERHLGTLIRSALAKLRADFS
jgi:hypothetical protein